MKKRFLDTSQLIALGQSGTLNLDYEPVVTYYGQQEIVNHGIILPTNSSIDFSPSWPDLGEPVYSGEWGNFYEWTDSSSGKHFQIYHYNRPFGRKAPCGCDATVQIFYNTQDFYCCESIAKKNTDFSYFMGTILRHLEISPPDTGDKCLGQTCNFTHFVLISNYQHNSSS